MPVVFCCFMWYIFNVKEFNANFRDCKKNKAKYGYDNIFSCSFKVGYSFDVLALASLV